MQKKSKLNVFAFMMLIIIGLTFQPVISTYAACPPEISSYWKLDVPMTAGTYEDFIKDNDGTGNANPDDASGIVNGAQDFDGTAGIDVPADKSFNWAVDDSFSIEFWVKRDGPTGAAQVVIGRSAGPTASNLTWWVGIEDTVASFVLGDNSGDIQVLTGTAIITADNDWHHVVAVRDSSVLPNGQNLLYVDGLLDVSVLKNYNAGFGSATAELNIGYWNFKDPLPGAPANRLVGMIDEVALYDRALTLLEIQAHYANGQPQNDYCLGAAPFVPFPDDTISLWDLDELNGPDYFDSFNGNDGMGSADPTAVTGQISGAQDFDGTAGIDVPADKSFNWAVDDSFSIEFWVKRDGPTGAAQVVIGRSAGPTASNLTWWVGIEDTVASFVLGDNSGDIQVLTGTAIITADNDWHHVVAVRDSSVLPNGQNLLYVDGLLDVSVLKNYNAGFGSATAELNIGYWNFKDPLPGAPANRLVGMIDEVALYDRALEQPEIEDHYEDGLDGKGIDDSGGGGGGGSSGGGGGGGCFITTMF